MANELGIPTCSGAHWYTQAREPRHNANLRQARKENPLPSVTSVIDIVRKYGLETWKIEQGIIGAVTQLAHDGESAEAFAKRVATGMSKDRLRTLNLSTQVHSATDDVVAGRQVVIDPEIKSLIEPALEWIETHLARKGAEDRGGRGKSRAGVCWPS